LMLYSPNQLSSKLFNLKTLARKGCLKLGNIISVDPDLYSKFMKHLSRTVKRDKTIQNITFKVGLSAYSDNPLNLGLRGPSSIGKTQGREGCASDPDTQPRLTTMAQPSPATRSEPL